MENPKSQIANRIKEANNVLVTVSSNPSVDQLSAAIGLTLLLTKLNKHATAVFSGQVPSTLEFLKPEETIEATTDSLRDFIIALDKSKADKLRYKVEDKMVKIFITPYRTSITDQDLEFSQGDFNVDVVVALGVHTKEELDQAITSHGRILHDATVATMNTQNGSELGSMNWADAQASSLCEMVVALGDMLKANSLDAQIATALLTGIVAETERFSNAKTTSNTMNASAKLMSAGANQQLVATKLEEPAVIPEEPANLAGEQGDGDGPAAAEADEDGSLRISHTEEKSEKPVEQIKINEQGELQPVAPPPPPSPAPIPVPQEPPTNLPAPVPAPELKREHRRFLDAPPEPVSDASMLGEPSETHTPSETHLIMEPPSFGGKLSATADSFDSDNNPLTLPSVEPPILSHNGDGSKQTDKSNELPQSPPPPDTTPPAPPPPKADSSAPVMAAAPEPPVLPTPQPPSQPPISTPPAAPPTPPPAPSSDVQPPAPAREEEEDKPAKLPKSVIDVMDDRTLDDIEEAVDSPHHVARDLARKAEDKKTLQTIEETVNSPHLQYEAHESEPPAQPTKVKQPKPTSPPDAAASDNVKPEKEAIPTLTIPEPSITPSSDEPTAAVEPPRDEDKADEQAASTDHPESEEVAAPPKDESEKPEGTDDNTAVDKARDAIAAAISAGGDGHPAPPPIESLGATDSGLDMGHATDAGETPVSKDIHIDDNGTISYPTNLVPNNTSLPADNTSTSVDDPTAPPPVPPPMMPPMAPPEDQTASK